jgi:hypothetical protein
MKYIMLIFLCCSFSPVIQAQSDTVTAATFPAIKEPANRTSVDQDNTEAMFPGGTEAWLQFIAANIRSQIPVKRNAPVGEYKVIIRFVVYKDGSIGNVVAETHWGYGIEEEIIRLVKNSPRWIPARVKGKPVKAYRRQPVTFLVEEE